ncbi:LysM peptidoglycan-binding domain-containing protein [Weissella confusa]|uniref:aggregation-promoting factor C-terminal-like domain-containing protein n=1 Tax=Weissella confusa TaxID=1583 RepID=UPI00107EF0D7|nr:LysM peptidoglycan-binding domain-containing protein [Weissella confusa]TGE79674.1 peptidoglycan-binding protein [Weissella confusa]
MNKKMITALTVAGLATFAMAENASADTYTVQSGDTLSQIAANHNTTVDTLVANNNIADANVIFVGQQVEIDGAASNASYDATQADVAAVVASQAPVTQQVSYTAPVTTVDYSAQSQAPVTQEVSYTAPVTTVDYSAQSQAPVTQEVSYTAPVTTVDYSAQSQAPVTQEVSYTAPVTTVDYSAQSQAPVTQEVSYTAPVATTTTTAAASGSTYDQFIAAGGTDAFWKAIVMPESGGNPDASNGQYKGLGQTNQSWGTGSVSDQTAGMLNYATSRYGSVDSAIAFRAANGWW